MGAGILDVEGGSRQLFDYVTNGMLEWVSMDEFFDVAVLNGERIGMPSGMEKQRSMLYDRFPDETLAIDSYFEAVDEWDGLLFVARALGGLTPAFMLPFWRYLVSRHTALSGSTVKERLGQIGASQGLQGTLGELP